MAHRRSTIVSMGKAGGRRAMKLPIGPRSCPLAQRPLNRAERRAQRAKARKLNVSTELQAVEIIEEITEFVSRCQIRRLAGVPRTEEPAALPSGPRVRRSERGATGLFRDAPATALQPSALPEARRWWPEEER